MTIGGHLGHLPCLPGIYANHLLNRARVIFLLQFLAQKDSTFSLLLACQNPDLVPPTPLWQMLTILAHKCKSNKKHCKHILRWQQGSSFLFKSAEQMSKVYFRNPCVCDKLEISLLPFSIMLWLAIQCLSWPTETGPPFLGFYMLSPNACLTLECYSTWLALKTLPIKLSIKNCTISSRPSWAFIRC